MVLLPAGILADLNIVGQNDVTTKAGFDSFLSNLALQIYLESDWDSEAGVGHLFSGYSFAAWDISSLPLPRVVKRKHSSFEWLVSIPGSDVAWLSAL